VGAVRFESNHLAFTNVKKNRKEDEGDAADKYFRPTGLRLNSKLYRYILLLSQIPKRLKPGQKGMIEGTYDATKTEGGEMSVIWLK